MFVNIVIVLLAVVLVGLFATRARRYPADRTIETGGPDFDATGIIDHGHGNGHDAHIGPGGAGGHGDVGGHM